MMRTTILAIVGAFVFTATAIAQDREELLRDCSTVSECLNLITSTLPEKDTGIITRDERQVAELLKLRFGRGARDALLQKAISEHGGWRNFAGGVLRHWEDWSEDDVPVLRRALQLNPGGSIAHVLAEVGSPAAIEALLEDLEKSGFENQTGWALYQLGPEVLQYLLPVLAAPSYDELPDDEPFTEGWRGAASLVSQFGSGATIIADDWIRIAKTRRESEARRIAALQGLAAMNGYLGEQTSSLRPLLRNRNEAIAEQAFETLVSTHDPSIARKLAATCKANGKKWDEFATESFVCLRRLAGFGSNAQSAGDLLLPFLKSPNKSEQLYAIEALGVIGYSPAIGEIEPFLNSPDWRHVYASVRALGQLNSRASVGKIESATRHHWLWELQQYSKRAVHLVIMNQPYSEILTDMWRLQLFGGFGNYNAPYDVTRECEWGVWSYRGEKLTFDEIDRDRQFTLSLSDGELTGSDRGEFSGSLVWRPKSGDEVTLVDDNTSQIFRVGDKFISIHGLSHMFSSYGFAALVTRSDDRQFSAFEIARFPAAAYQVKQLDADLFAANADGRVVIFSTEGVVEAARCDWSARPEGQSDD